MQGTQAITSRILETRLINWREAKWLQNDNLKEWEDEAVVKLKNSLLENQFVMPFNVWQEKDVIWILDGHHRQKALELLIAEGINVPDLLPATFVLCDNIQQAAELVLVYTSQYAKITQQGLFDFGQKFELDFTKLNRFIDLPDFSIDRFEQKFDIFGVQDLAEAEEEIPEVTEANLIVKFGDKFQLGNHFIICGDSTKLETFETLMQGKKAQIILTDPPYNLPYKEFGGKGSVQHENFAMGAGEMSNTEFVEFLASYMKNCVVHSLDGSIHCHWMDFRHVWHVCEAANKAETYQTPEPKQICVWNKSVGANSSFYWAKHEFCIIFKHGTAKHKSHLELADRIRYNVWDFRSANDFGNPDRERRGSESGIGVLANHPTPKPTDMLAQAILDLTDVDDIVLDCFLGSGSTLISAEQTDRICYGIEYEPKYIQSTILRYYNYCVKNNQTPIFAHLNGSLTLNDILNGQSEPEPERN
jgi:DNA modification methylase